MNIILGAGATRQEGWISTDKSTLDVTSEQSFSDYFKESHADAFLAEHVWEHLTLALGLKSAALCCAYLKPGGRFRIAVPDGLHPDPGYIEWVRPGGSGAGADDHRMLYDHVTLRMMLSNAGFSRVDLLEWWDEGGTFHSKIWRPEDGLVRRSKKHDGRNVDGVPRYTSLIADAIKSPVL